MRANETLKALHYIVPTVLLQCFQELEEEINIHYEEMVKDKSHDQLLTNQLQRLVMCFDVYLETEAGTGSSEGPSEIAREKVFSRLARYFNQSINIVLFIIVTQVIPTMGSLFSEPLTLVLYKFTLR